MQPRPPFRQALAAQAHTTALTFIFLWFLIGGLAHFTATDLEMKIVPPWIPWPKATVLISGALELIGAAGLLWPRSRRAAGWGLFVLTIAVTPANVHMLQHAADFPSVPHWALVLRLPLQALLLALIAWGSGMTGHRRSARPTRTPAVPDNRAPPSPPPP